MSRHEPLIVGFAAAQGTMARQEELIEALRSAIPEDPWVDTSGGEYEDECYICRADSLMSNRHHEPGCPWAKATTLLKAWDER